jgi:hypothetical protein
MTTTSGDDNDAILPGLRQLADQIRVRIHLAGLEAKDAWAKAEHKLHELEEKAKQATGRAKEQLSELGGTLERELRELVGRLPKDDAKGDAKDA